MDERGVAPDIGKQALSLKQDDDKDLTTDERLIKQLGVENGDRAEYLRKLLDGKSVEDFGRLTKEWHDKGLASDEIVRQLRLSTEALKKRQDVKARHEYLLKARKVSRPAQTSSGIKSRNANAP
jgi:UDP-N-acetylglucosamine 2-epimerase